MGKYQVAPNKTIISPDGSRFIARGVQMFDYLLCGFEARADYRYRGSLGGGVSAPTYYGRVCWKSPAHVRSELKAAKAEGANLIRVGVEPAVQFASVSYIDPADGLTYPSDIDMLDTIVEEAEALGMVIQLQQSNDAADDQHIRDFLFWIGNRYKNRYHVWLNPCNEPYGYRDGGANVNNAAMWAARIGPMLSAIRLSGFDGPVCIDPPGWAERVDLITGYLSASPFSSDPNLIIDVHVYPRAGEYDFRTARLPEITTRWAQYVGNYCIKVGEIGIDNLSGRLDGGIDQSIPSVNLTEWARMQSFIIDFLGWSLEREISGPFNGVIGHMWMAYIPGLSRHDDNTMRRIDGTWTTWGNIYRQNYLRPAISTLPVLRSLTGLNQGRINSPAYGSPIFQAEGRTGARAAATYIMQGSWDTYVSYHNRGTGASVGAISGNGGGGINYASLSDPRAKENIKSLNGHWERLSRLRPVSFKWKSNGKPDAGFLSTEFGKIYRNSVTGEPGAVDNDGVPIMQTIDASSGEVIADIIAALQDLRQKMI